MYLKNLSLTNFRNFARLDLDLPDGHIEASIDLPCAEILTRSQAAFRSLIDGLKSLHVDQDWLRCAEHLEQAVADDPTFSLVYLVMLPVYGFSNQGEKQQEIL